MQVKFLVVRFSSIGDIVLTTPVVRGLKQQVEDAEVHYLTKPQFAGILENNPHIDKVHTLKRTLKETVESLREENYDYIIDLHHNLRTLRLKNKLRVLDFSFNKLNKEKWMMVHLKKNRLPDTHIVDRYLETVSVFDITDDKEGLDYFIPTKDKVTLSDYSLSQEKPFVTYVIGGQHSTKRMPKEMIRSLCEKIDYPVVLLGGKEDSEDAKFISEELTNVIDLCGQINLNASSSIVEQCSLVITHDTGLMHIAAAFKKTIFSIWGNTIPQFGMYPYRSSNDSKIFEVSDLKCRPCSKIGFDKCPKKHFNCMVNQDIELIAKEANAYLA